MDFDLINLNKTKEKVLLLKSTLSLYRERLKEKEKRVTEQRQQLIPILRRPVTQGPVFDCFLTIQARTIKNTKNKSWFLSLNVD